MPTALLGSFLHRWKTRRCRWARGDAGSARYKWGKPSQEKGVNFSNNPLLLQRCTYNVVFLFCLLIQTNKRVYICDDAPDLSQVPNLGVFLEKAYKVFFWRLSKVFSSGFPKFPFDQFCCQEIRSGFKRQFTLWNGGERSLNRRIYGQKEKRKTGEN